MRLMIVRHAEAASREQDPERGLSARGQAQATALGRQLAALDLAPPTVWHSHKARARQTAVRIAAELLPPPTPCEHPGLAPDAPIEPLVRELLGATRDTLLVGHLPFVRYLTFVLMTHPAQDPPDFPTAVCALLVRDAASGAWTLERVLEPRE